jgi:hypothetical protein
MNPGAKVLPSRHGEPASPDRPPIDIRRFTPETAEQAIRLLYVVAMRDQVTNLKSGTTIATGVRHRF